MAECMAIAYRQTLETPAEFCENEAREGHDYCNEHLHPDYDL